MATVQDKIDAIEAEIDYVAGSLVITSWDQRGCVVKWLVDVDGIGNRKKRFFALDESEYTAHVMTKTVLAEKDVVPAE